MLTLSVLFVAVLLAAPVLLGQYQRSPPDFSGSEYRFPTPAHPEPVAAWRNILDAAILAAGLGLAAWLILRRRSRTGAVLVGIGGLAWFGFVKQGCICPIGSIQNVSLALAEPRYAISFAIVAIFFLPLLAALFFGRVFCAGICPHGAIQDVVLLRDIRVPRLLDRALGLFKYAYLVLAVWWAGWGLAPLLGADAAGRSSRRFIICEWDPFVGLFRLSGPSTMLLVGGGILLLSTFLGRPYCRWICPYGALLSIASRIAWRPLRVTPDKELECGLCKDACPYGAIRDNRAVPADCLVCARCYDACPRDKLMRRSRLRQKGRLVQVEREPRKPSRAARAASRALGVGAVLALIVSAGLVTATSIGSVRAAPGNKAAVAAMKEKSETDASIAPELRKELDRQREESLGRWKVYDRGGAGILVSAAAFIAWARWLRPRRQECKAPPRPAPAKPSAKQG